MKKHIANWTAFNSYWIRVFRGELLVVKYEDVKKDIASEVKRMTNFLNISVTDQAVKCTANNSGGSHHRTHTHTYQNIFSDEMMQDIDYTVCSVEKYIT